MARIAIVGTGISGLGAAVCEKPEADALFIVTPYGQDISTSITQQGLDAARTVGLDTLHELAPGRRRTLMLSPPVSVSFRLIEHWLRENAGIELRDLIEAAR